ncbi:regulatory protein GemA [Xanthobacter sp. VTT E-85241]|uniref:regulatory protein GemA n=1 Tax=Roseixanthobacter finlandensis TaxID=3119922 RepID=UPI00372C36AF
MSTATTAQIGAIHALAKKIGLDEDGRRNVIASAAAGKRSSKDLNRGEAIAVIDRLQQLAGVKGHRRPSLTADGKYAPLLRALWLDAYNLGIARSRDDAALIAFVQRQTGVAHTRFLTDWDSARPAIEGLKAWITREAGVQWPSNRDGLSVKVEIVRAQAARLADLGASLPRGLSDLHDPVTAEKDLHRVQQALGKCIRSARAKREAQAQQVTERDAQ